MCHHEQSICSHHNVSSNVKRPRRNSSLQCIIHVDKKICKVFQNAKWQYCLLKGPFYNFVSMFITLFPDISFVLKK